MKLQTSELIEMHSSLSYQLGHRWQSEGCEEYTSTGLYTVCANMYIFVCQTSQLNLQHEHKKYKNH